MTPPTSPAISRRWLAEVIGLLHPSAASPLSPKAKRLFRFRVKIKIKVQRGHQPRSSCMAGAGGSWRLLQCASSELGLPAGDGGVGGITRLLSHLRRFVR